ncbi:MAG: NifU family protein [Myxococcota bacterium]
MTALSDESTLQAVVPEESELEESLNDLARLEAVIERWEETQIRTVTAVRETVERLNREALRRLIKAVKDVPEARGALKEAVSDPLLRSVLDYHGLLKAPRKSLEERVREAIESVRPQLQSHGGDAELVGIRDGSVAEVRLTGNCNGCPSSSITLHHGVEEAIAVHAPEIERVVQVRGTPKPNAELVQLRTSPFSLERRGFTDAACVGDVPSGAVIAVEVDGQSVLLSRVGDTVKAYRNACSHLGMPLDGGEVAGGIITCPYHGFEFALDSGDCLTAPDVTLVGAEVQIEKERVWVKLP